MLPNKHKVIRKPVSSFLDSSTTSSLKYFEATSTGNDNVRSANANWQLNIHGHLSTLIFMLQPMQVTILLPATIWSAFVQLTLTQYGPTLTVVRNNSGQQSYGCNLSLIIFPWSKCSLRSDSYKFGITLSAWQLITSTQKSSLMPDCEIRMSCTPLSSQLNLPIQLEECYRCHHIRQLRATSPLS